MKEKWNKEAVVGWLVVWMVGWLVCHNYDSQTTELAGIYEWVQFDVDPNKNPDVVEEG